MKERLPNRRLLNQLTAELISWLDLGDVDSVLNTIAGWDQATWQAAERVVLIQGIGPYLQQVLPQTPVYAVLPGSFREWLAMQHDLNGLRVQRLHEDLAAILTAAGRAGVAVMPLKGSLLTLYHYQPSAVRPMADIDLLVRPDQEPALRQVLEGLGYRSREPLDRPVPVRGFINPGGDQVIEWGAEHPDNPRPVEVHVKLAKTLWDGHGGYDLTDHVWSESCEVELLGARAWVPAADRFLCYLAVHAMYHLFSGTGRAVYFLDLAQLAPEIPRLAPPDANWIYPVLRLAARALPRRFADVDLGPLAAQTLPWLRQWAQDISLNARCGLNIDPYRRVPNSLVRRWRHWRPTPLHLAIGYGEEPRPATYGRHAQVALRRLVRRLERS